MADPALSTDPLERYGAVERAYCEERWTSVIHDGQTLLADLSRAEEVPPEGLRERLQLLIGHAFLYGLGDRDSAEDLYQAVMRSGAEPSLRQIAEQGLQQCALPVAIAAEDGAEAPTEQEPPPDQGLAAPEAAVISEWPQADAAPTLEVASAAPQSLQDDGSSSVPPDSAAGTGALSWLITDASAAAQAPENPAQPVMPWLTTDSADSAVAPAPDPTPPVVAPDSLSSSPDTTSPVDGLAPFQRPGDAIHVSEASAPLQSVSLAKVPNDAAGADDAARPVPDRQEAALESSGSEASSAAAAAFRTPILDAGQSGSSEDPVSTIVVMPAQPWLPQEPSVAPEPAAHQDEAPGIPPAGLASGPLQESLVPDVVDEPELIELYQADELRREELLVQAEVESAPATVSEMEAAIPAAAEAVPPGRVDRRAGADLPIVDLSLEVPELPLSPVVEPEIADLADAAGPTLSVVAGSWPFSASPEPVAEEDPELLMGLLKVEMG